MRSLQPRCPASATASRDVLLAGHFANNGVKLIRAFRARANRTGINAVDVLDFNDATLWEESLTGVAGVAGSITAAPALGVTASLTATCVSSLSMPYNSVVTGGSSSGLSYAWTFTGRGTTSRRPPARRAARSSSAPPGSRTTPRSRSPTAARTSRARR